LVEVIMNTVQRAIVACIALALPLAGVLAEKPTPCLAGPAANWTLLQSLAKSGDVHSPTFITPTRGFSVVGNRLLQTNDGGQRWSVFLPAEWTSRLPRALSFADPIHGWAVGDGFVIATRDGGAHWSAQATAPAEGCAWVGVQALDGSRAFAISSGGIVLGTDDGGITWSVRADVAGGSLRALHFADAHGWAVGADSSGRGLVLATIDGGATWHAQATPAAAELSAVSFTDAVHGWAAGAAGVLRTCDGGVTWSQVGSPLGSAVSRVRAHLAFVSATHGFLGVEDGGAGPSLWETTDAGATWTPDAPIAEPAGCYGLVALDSTHVLATGLSRTTPDALTTGRIWEWTAGSTGSAPTAAPRIASRRRFGVIARRRARSRRAATAARRASSARRASCR
jgi:photosystem II stability/assembly factor-like uncharacterized protein